MITPCHNEQAYLRNVWLAIQGQSRKPDLWLFVDDRSTDDTPLILNELSGGWIECVRKDVSIPGDASFQAFRFGLKTLKESSDLIMKLDADSLLPLDYFQVMINRFEQDLKLGIGSGICRGETWLPSHPRGNNRIYRKECIDSIQFPSSGIGWDTVDEVMARSKGWNVKAFPDVVVTHMRPKLLDPRYRFEQGMVSKYLGYPMWFTLGRAGTIIYKTGPKQGLAYFKGYLSGGYGSAEPEIRRAVRKDQLQRLFRV